MSDLAPHKARVDAARDLAHLARIGAVTSAIRRVEGWTEAEWREFNDYRQAKADELEQKIRMEGR